MSDSETTHKIDTAVPANDPTTILGAQETAPAVVNADEGWEVEDVGRVRGETFQSVVAAEQHVAAEAEGDDPDALGTPSALPESQIGDDDDGPARDVAPKTAAPKASKGKLALSKRVEQLKGKIHEETRIRRELEAGNLDVARRLLSKADAPAPRDRPPVVEPSARQDRQRREDGTFLPVSRGARDVEPVVPPKPVRPIYKQMEADGKTWEDYQEAIEAYTDAIDTYNDKRFAHREWTLRQEVGTQIASTQQRMEQMSMATARERADAAFKARRHVVQQEYGEQKWQQVAENWRQYDEAGYESPFLETVIQLHEGGARVMGMLGEQIEKAAILADYDEWTAGMFDGIMALEDPAPVLLALADDPKEFERISQLPRPKATAAIGALSGRLAATAGERVHGSRPARVSKAPAPARPVGGRREGGTDADAPDLENMPFEDYLRVRNEQTQGRR